jgi:hypothetical protein
MHLLLEGYGLRFFRYEDTLHIERIDDEETFFIHESCVTELIRFLKFEFDFNE